MITVTDTLNKHNVDAIEVSVVDMDVFRSVEEKKEFVVHTYSTVLLRAFWKL
jgi:hypothetical protein